MKLKQITGMLSLITIVVVATGCNNNRATEQTPERVKVRALKVAEREVDQTGSFTGTIESEVVNNIVPQTPMRIKNVVVEVGDRVRAGQKLAEMDAVNLNQTRLQMENDKVEFERVDELYKVGGISKSVWDARKLAYNISQTAYRNLLENTELRSPIAGLITRRNYDSGDMFNGGLPIYVIEQINPSKLIVHVSEALLTRVHLDMDVVVRLDAFANETFEGKVKRIHPSVDPATRTFPVEIQIKNPRERILPGMFARATFNYGAINRAMVPDRAVVRQSGTADHHVFVCLDGVARFRRVEIGQLIGNEFEVISGLEPGETVAVTALNRLNDGTEIEIENNESGM